MSVKISPFMTLHILSIASVSPNTDISHDTADFISQLSAHVKVLDFPTSKSRLLDLLVKHKPAAAMPNEPLGVTDRITHHIRLKPDTRPSFVPSFHFSHSQRVVVQNLVHGMLKHYHPRITLSMELTTVFGSKERRFFSCCS